MKITSFVCDIETCLALYYDFAECSVYGKTPYEFPYRKTLTYHEMLPITSTKIRVPMQNRTKKTHQFTRFRTMPYDRL